MPKDGRKKPVSPEATSRFTRAGSPFSREERLRLRAAWMYHIEEMTQSDIANRLGVGRVSVVRLLAEARRNQEIKVWVDSPMAETVVLERALERQFGLEEAIVVPVAGSGSDVRPVLGAAAGQYLSETIKDGMAIGVGWGQTMMAMLSSLASRSLPNTSVVSLLGAISKAKRLNPSDFAWQFARLLEADCHLLTAPALVDSADTRDILLNRCGLNDIFERARHLDMAVLSVGCMAADATPFSLGSFSQADRLELLKRGAVGDVIYQFCDENGKSIDYLHNDRLMSVPVSTLRHVPRKVLISGGAEKNRSLLGAIRFLEPTTLITDEIAAASLMALVEK